MDKLPDERKGVVWGLMTAEERKTIRQAIEDGLHPIIYEYNYSGKYEWQEMTEDEFVVRNLANYAVWIAEWVPDFAGRRLLNKFRNSIPYLELVMRCKYCNKQEIMSSDRNEPIDKWEAVVRNKLEKFFKQGWRLEGDKYVCPECVRRLTNEANRNKNQNH